MPDAHVPDDDAVLASIDAVFDFVCSRRLSDLWDPEDSLALLGAATPARIAAWHARLVVPQRERLQKLASVDETRLSAWLPDDVRAELESMLGEPAPLPPKLVDEAVASDRVRDEVRAMLEEMLRSFLAKALGGKEDAPATGLRGALGRGALGFAAASKTILGGLGEKVKEQLEDRVRDFVDGSVSAVQTRIADKLKSKETAENLGRRRRDAFVRAMETTSRDAAKLVTGPAVVRLDALLPRIIVHNLARTELRVLLLTEGRAIVDELSTQTIGALLDEAGVRDEARRIARARLAPMLRAFADSGALARVVTLLSA